MMTKLKYWVLPVSALLLALGSGCSLKDRPVIKNEQLGDHWVMQSSAKVAATGKEISSVGFKPENWYAATVPGSVLGSLVADSVYKNIFYGRNLDKIPDSLFNVPWWYRVAFYLDKPHPDQVVRLRFNGINYKADIWLNGRKIASSDTVEGGFRRFTFKVTEAVKQGENILAVKITRPHSGDLTLGFVDWNPAPPDHNMGIWRSVKLIVSGPVSIDEPFIETNVDTATLDHAELTVSALLQNHSDKTISGTLKGTIGNKISFSEKVTLSPTETKKIIFDPRQYPQLSIDHPKLWWVHNWGKPNLYNLHLEFEGQHAVSDSNHVRFGIRQVSGYITSDGHRGFRLNGRKILIKGGGWTDPMLLNATPAYEQAGIDYAVHMNLNTIRMEGFWGHDQHLYDLCDEKGILIMAGLSCQWEWKEYLGTKEDQYSAIATAGQNDIAAASWHDQVVWLRNHPGIFLWLYGSDKLPRPSLEKRYLAVLREFDTTRPAISSAAERSSVLTGPSAVKMRGPYDYVPPVYWYADTAYGGAFGFNTETGPGPQIPVLESLKKMIPADSLWPIGNSWLYHTARHEFHNLTHYNRAMTERLGKPVDLRDYLRKAQYLNYEGMRAMFEAFEVNRFKATGIIQWMYNASWPKLWWQLYDYYLMPTGAFYGTRKANEPVHIAYDYGKHSIDVINNTLGTKENLSAGIDILDFDLKHVLQKTIRVQQLNGRQTHEIFHLPDNLNLSKTWFLDLKLYDEQHHLISTNFYVLSTQKDELEESKTTWFVTPQSQYADLTLLQRLPEVKPDIKQFFTGKRDTTFVTVKLKNPTSHLAFMVHLDLKKKESHKSVTPVFWGDNYITLLPEEERTVTGYCHLKNLDGERPVVTIDGWNIE
jgi:exo-1,4-beta-D-glucosaminidase